MSEQETNIQRIINRLEDVDALRNRPASTGIEVRRAGRADLSAIAALVRKASRSKLDVDEADVLDWLFGKGLVVAIRDDTVIGVAGWQAENLLSVTDVFYVSPSKLLAQVGAGLLAAIEEEASLLMCEANVLLLPAWSPNSVRTFLQKQGYEPKDFAGLHRIWREVLSDFVGDEPNLMVKRLRDRMVMVPI